MTAHLSLWFNFFILAFFLFQNCSKVNFSKNPETQAESVSSYSDSAPSTEQEIVETDDSSQRGMISGKVTNAVNNEPIIGAQILIHDSQNQVVASLTTDSSGEFSSSHLDQGNYIIIFSADGFISISNVGSKVIDEQITVINKSLSSTELEVDQIRIVLNWSDPKWNAAEDIDSYLVTPQDDQPIYFDNKIGSGVQLDIDILHWRGPETTTITELHSGKYVFYVNNYSSRWYLSALGDSDISIAVYRGTQLIRLYEIPPGNGLSYEVFHIIDGEIVDVLQYNDTLSVAR